LPHHIPEWVDMWPSAESAAPNGPRVYLRLHGSFAWNQRSTPVLRDLHIDVPVGQMVAIVGEVGSGKSTLMQAILGELYPENAEKASLSRPEVIAYCSQVPHIAEGTLKDNVLFGQECDEARYNEAISGASLEPDLKVLPGGDGVPIGSRGITLSGGQKARVAMARAAYHKASQLVLLDDPFGAVDAPTATHLLDKLFLGPLMKDRTRVVILQPDAERLKKFDLVVVMESGKIAAQGTLEEVIDTNAYQKLLASRKEESFIDEAPADHELIDVSEAAVLNHKSRVKEDNRGLKIKLREDDFEGRPTWTMIKHYCQMGRWRNIINTSMLFFIQVFIWLLADICLANWTNSIARDSNTNGGEYVKAYLFWFSIGCIIWVVCWKFGMWFTLRISKDVLGLMLHRLLRAPVDKFFDKHPIGRIMNRIVADIAAVDFSLFLRTTGTIGVVYSTLIPLIYIHFIVPWFITLLAIPLYWLIWSICVRYWNTTVPLKYCATNARSDANTLIADVSSNNTVIRAYGDQERVTLGMCDAMDDQLKASLYGERILRRWLMCRINFLWSFYTTTTYIVGILNVRYMGAGTLGLCLANLFMLESMIEANLDHATGAQMELIALARINEYLSVPQEKARQVPSDIKYRSFAARMQRLSLGSLTTSIDKGGVIEVLRAGQPVLRSTPCGSSFVAVAEKTGALGLLCPSCPELRQSEAWHRIVAVNDAVRDAAAIAQELCQGSSATLVIDVLSGWVADGAAVEVQNLKVGYADIPRDVLKGISLSFEARAKVAVVGTTGCGKSSLLLALLRILEPRAGRILINGVDTRDVGLATLRQCLGLVPQDPMLFSGTLRHNLDPFGLYTDGRIWHALGLAHLTELVDGWPHKLDYQLHEEGGNLSFGQRQLVCLARMVLRQPALLLLDEATSAIDPHTQESVQTTIASAFPFSTLVAVAHRLETILDFDHVVVMERGDVAEEGGVREVAQRKDGILRKMLAAKSSW